MNKFRMVLFTFFYSTYSGEKRYAHQKSKK